MLLKWERKGGFACQARRLGKRLDAEQAIKETGFRGAENRDFILFGPPWDIALLGDNSHFSSFITVVATLSASLMEMRKAFSFLPSLKDNPGRKRHSSRIRFNRAVAEQ